MPRPYRLDDLRLRCQRRANKENDPSIGNPEWNMLISEQYGELYSEVEKTGMRHFDSTTPFTITANGSTTYAVPTDHLATIALYRVLNAAGSKVELDEMMAPELPRWAGQVGDAQTFAVIGSSIYLFPKPSSGSYELWYMPQAPDLSTAADSTSVDLVQADGESFLINGVAFKAQSKGASVDDPRALAAEREAARVRFVDWCTLRAFTQPRRPVRRYSINELLSAGDYVDDPGGFWQVKPL
ncbi:MAG TPA: hypothetical protein VJU58_04100 [Microbacterium sp.]|nr:hypothetical protein [Microbacterium sp.]